jgi:hypothetical protein
MTRLLVAAGLAAVLTYCWFPKEFRVLSYRVEQSAHSATASVVGAVRGLRN